MDTYGATGRIKASSNDMVIAYMPMVKRLAYHLAAKLSSNIEVDDLIQVGMIGLMDAISRFQTAENEKFEAYASIRIKGAMVDELRRNDWLPQNLRNAQKQIEKAIQKVSHQKGRHANDSEVAAHLNMSLQNYQKILGLAKGAMVVQIASEDEEGTSWVLDLPDESLGSNPTAVLDEKEMRGEMIRAIETLPVREKMLLSMHYEHEMNFREISAVFGVNEHRVSQIHTSAILRIRAHLRSVFDSEDIQESASEEATSHG